MFQHERDLHCTIPTEVDISEVLFYKSTQNMSFKN